MKKALVAFIGLTVLLLTYAHFWDYNGGQYRLAMSLSGVIAFTLTIYYMGGLTHDTISRNAPQK